MGNKKKTFEDCVLQDKKDGVVTIATLFGFEHYNLDEFVKQPVEGLLYDLNMDEATLLTFLSNDNQQEALGYVNQWAAAQVIKKLKEQVDNLKNGQHKESD